MKPPHFCHHLLKLEYWILIIALWLQLSFCSAKKSSTPCSSRKCVFKNRETARQQLKKLNGTTICGQILNNTFPFAHNLDWSGRAVGSSQMQNRFPIAAFKRSLNVTLFTRLRCARNNNNKFYGAVARGKVLIIL